VGFGSSGARAQTEIEVAGRLFYLLSNQVLPTYFRSGAKRESCCCSLERERASKKKEKKIEAKTINI
jgi:hypothetical protein